MTDMIYVTQEMWDRAQVALRASLPVIERCVPALSTAGTMISLRNLIRKAIAEPLETTAPRAHPFISQCCESDFCCGCGLQRLDQIHTSR